MFKNIHLHIILLLLLPLSSVSAQQVAIPIEQLTLVGSGKMSYLFWDIYIAKLYTQTGIYNNDHTMTALEFNYLRDIKAEDLVNETLKQWRNLKLKQHEDEQQWLRQLITLWPDISEGDQLVFFINAQGHAEFYYNGNLTGSLDSTEFSYRFKQIWLSDKTSAPGVRRKLIRSSPGK